MRWQLIKAAANPRLLAAKLAHLIPLVAKLIKLDVRFIKFLQNNFYLQHFDKPCLIFLTPFWCHPFIMRASERKQGPPIRLINIFLIQLINSRRK